MFPMIMILATLTFEIKAPINKKEWALALLSLSLFGNVAEWQGPFLLLRLQL